MRLPNSIRPRLMLIVALALAPLALASVIQAVLNFRAYQQETDRILVQTTLYAAYSEQNIFTRAEQLLRSLARRPGTTGRPGNCFAALSDALVGAMPIVNFTRVDASGAVVCMAVVAPPRPAYAKLSWWPALRKADHIIIGNQFNSTLLKRPLLPIVIPLHEANGSFAGAISASVDLQWLETAPQVTKLPEGGLSLILDSEGRVLAASKQPPSGMAKQVVTQAQDAKQRVFTINSDAGQRWRWVAEPIGISDKYVAFGIPEPRLFGTFRGYLLADVLLTLLIVLATCAAIWMGTEWLVIRWTLYLTRVAVAYGRNHFGMSLQDMRSAPFEFRRLGREMKRMAFAIQERDRTLSKALERQFAMTREIHHRVKNNLQIVSSLIAIYATNIANPIARSAFRQIIARVDALTLIQRLIEKSDTDPTLDMGMLFEQLADQIRTLAADAGQRLTLHLSAGAQWVPPDIATPLVLFVIEALTYDIFAGRSEPMHRDVRVEFSMDHNFYLLTIEDECPGALPNGPSLSERVLRSLTEQLRGRLGIEPFGRGGTRLVLQIPLEGSVTPDHPPVEAPPENVYVLESARSRPV